MAHRNLSEAYDITHFENYAIAPKQVPNIPVVTKPKAIQNKKAKQKQKINELRRFRAVFRLEICVFAICFVVLTAVTLYGKVKLSEDIIEIGDRQQVLGTLMSEKTRLVTELEQQFPSRVVEAYATTYLGMVRMNDYQKNYLNTSEGEKVDIVQIDKKNIAGATIFIDQKLKKHFFEANGNKITGF